MRAGVHWNTVARWERDEVRITEPMARYLALLATVPTTPTQTQTGIPTSPTTGGTSAGGGKGQGRQR